jgi:hypothetical protein
MYRGEIEHEFIHSINATFRTSEDDGGTMRQCGVYLAKHKDLVFPDLPSFVAYYAEPRPELLCPLLLPRSARSVQPTRGLKPVPVWSQSGELHEKSSSSSAQTRRSNLDLSRAMSMQTLDVTDMSSPSSASSSRRKDAGRSTSDPSLTRRLLQHASEQYGAQPWYRVGLGRREALLPLLNQPSGSFVVRSSESRPDSFVLSYLVDGRPQHERLLCPTGDLTKAGLRLAAMPDLAFNGLEDLLTACSRPNSTLLRCPLRYIATLASLGEPSRTAKRRQMAASLHGQSSHPHQHQHQLDTSIPSMPSSMPSSVTASPRSANTSAATSFSAHSPAIRDLSNTDYSAPRLSYAAGRGHSGVSLAHPALTALPRWNFMHLSPEDALACLATATTGEFVIRKSAKPKHFALLTMMVDDRLYQTYIDHDPLLGSRDKKKAMKEERKERKKKVRGHEVRL